MLLRQLIVGFLCNNDSLWLWVPAFAGTTAESVAPAARRANHRYRVNPRHQKQFSLPEFRFTLLVCRPGPPEGRFAIVTIRWALDAMDAAGVRCLHRTKTHAADGE